MSPMERHGTSTPEEREKALDAASLAVQRGGLVVLPTWASRQPDRSVTMILRPGCT